MAILLNDIGHGRNTWPPSKGISASGGVPGMAEHSFNAAVGAEVKRLLSGKLRTFEAQPPNGLDVSLTKRTTAYNAQYYADRTAIGMSHHANYSTNKKVRGFGVFYWHTSATAKKLAQRVLAEYKKEFPDMPIWGNGLFASRVGDWTNFAMLRDTAAPFVLIEWEFFSNDDARKDLLSTDYRKRCAKVAARAAAGWYGIKLDEVEQVVKPKPISPAPSRDYLLHGDVFLSVGALQAGLNRSGIRPPLEVDNIYGDSTEKAVKAFQKANGLEVDGIWGKNSAAKLAAILKSQTAEKPKEDEDMPDKAIVINSEADLPAVTKLHVRTGWGIWMRNAVKEKIAKELIIAGGGPKGLEKYADKLTDLSGKTRRITVDNVDDYTKKL